jgi:hypothetical protein
MGNAQSKRRNEMGEDGPAPPSLLKFTREDETRLFGNNIQNIDPEFINEFRMLYSSNDEAIPLYSRLCVFMVSVDEIENRGLYLGCRGLNEGDIVIAGCIAECKGLKLPVGIVPKYCNKSGQSGKKDDFLRTRWEYIACRAWNELRQEVPILKCGVCANSPAPILANTRYHCSNRSVCKIDHLYSSLHEGQMLAHCQQVCYKSL